MGKENKPNGNGPAAAVDFCPVDGCKKPTKRMHFCEEHFSWFKEGLINKKGDRPTDFDKKYQLYMRKKSAA